MAHFSLEQWVDFARNVIGLQKRAEMESHLSACKQCSKTLSMWQRVYAVGRSESAYAPPDGVVRIVKASFATQRPHRVGRVAQVIASLLFDSASVPLPVGVRSGPGVETERHLLYGANDYRIDIRIAPLPNSNKVTVVGQVLNSAAPGDMIGAVPVKLQQGRKVLAESTTSPFGEFSLESSLGENAQLSVKLPSHELYLPLAGPRTETAAISLESTELKTVSDRPASRKKRPRKKRV